ncbi:MAG TPA: hypothetical protein VFQ54_02850 [Thermomicrobiales bacterium]|nr:hypothetical protein [Thermomicrobiales bacterium]
MKWQAYASVIVLLYVVSTLLIVQRADPDDRPRRGATFARLSLPVLVAWLAVTSTLLF